VPPANTKAPEPKPQPDNASSLKATSGAATSAKATSAKATSAKTASAKTVAAKPDGIDPAEAQDAPHQDVSPPAAPENLSPDVAQPVMPDVTAKARNTIHGKVPIVVRVEADAGGAVTDVKVESGASSKYFADLAVKAAHQWKFVPGAAPRAWNVRFEFTHNADRPVAVQVTPTH
jgi:TonB family protein